MKMYERATCQGNGKFTLCVKWRIIFLLGKREKSERNVTKGNVNAKRENTAPQLSNCSLSHVCGFFLRLKML